MPQFAPTCTPTSEQTRLPPSTIGFRPVLHARNRNKTAVWQAQSRRRRARSDHDSADKPWKASTPTEKTAASNGLLLNAFHDRAFDQGLISIDDDYRIMVNHDKVRHSPVNDQWLYAFEDQRITLPQSANLRMNLSRTTTNTYFSPKLHSHRDNPFPTHSTLPGDIQQIALRLFLPKHQSCPQVALPA